MARIITIAMLLISIEFILFLGGAPILSNQLCDELGINGFNYLGLAIYVLMITYIGLLAASGFSAGGWKIATESSARAGIGIPLFGFMAADLLSIGALISSASPFAWPLKMIVGILFAGFVISFFQWLSGNDI